MKSQALSAWYNVARFCNFVCPERYKSGLGKNEAEIEENLSKVTPIGHASARSPPVSRSGSFDDQRRLRCIKNHESTMSNAKKATSAAHDHLYTDRAEDKAWSKTARAV